MYGSTRIGVKRPVGLETNTRLSFEADYDLANINFVPGSVNHDPLSSDPPCTDGCLLTRTLGKKEYEFTNHLGNVLVTVSDVHLPEGSAASHTVSNYVSDVIGFSDYYVFGSAQSNRAGGDYRYAFNGQEEESELEGAYFYTYRLADSRLGRFYSIDPLCAQFPYNSPYAFCENSTIEYVELEGLERYYAADGRYIGSYAGGENSEEIRITTYSYKEGKSIFENNPQYQEQFNANSTVAYTSDEDMRFAWARKYGPKSVDKEYGMVIFSINIYVNTPGEADQMTVYAEGTTCEGPASSAREVDVRGSQLKAGNTVIGIADDKMFGDGVGWERSSMIHTHAAGKSTELSLGGVLVYGNGVDINGDVANSLNWSIPIYMAHHDNMLLKKFDPAKYWAEMDRRAKGTATSTAEKKYYGVGTIDPGIVNCVKETIAIPQ